MASLQMTKIWILIAMLATILKTNVTADLFDYTDTNAAYIGDSNLNLLLIPQVSSEIITSNKYLAGTNDLIFATFVGDFSSSGPHNIGRFNIGTTEEVTTTLTRVIGNLQSIMLQKNGTDGWLLSNYRCTINNIRYELSGPNQWLDNFDPSSFALYGNGYEPNAANDLPASATMQLAVIAVFNL
jgi:hypothetical protein